MLSVGPCWDSRAHRVLDHPLSVVAGDLPVPPLGYVAVLVPLLNGLVWWASRATLLYVDPPLAYHSICQHLCVCVCACLCVRVCVYFGTCQRGRKEREEKRWVKRREEREKGEGQHCPSYP